MIYRIEQHWLEHEGGTKFYHLLQIQQGSGDGFWATAIMAHYGKLSIVPTGLRANPDFFRPIKGGQTSLKNITLHAAINAKTMRSSNGNYIHARAGATITQFKGNAEFLPWLHSNFKPDDRTLINNCLHGVWPASVGTIEGEDGPMRAPETIVIPDARPAAWGSW